MDQPIKDRPQPNIHSVYHIFRPCKLDATEVWSTTGCSWSLGSPLRYSTIDEL
ncbi:hypothetical protein L208DRAFT_1412114 [Tricholoma matsutake]|nr:hypothetical protein L208DRAFT_1412114 [Tricholoma matsutake 945]